MTSSTWTEYPGWKQLVEDMYQKSAKFHAELATKQPGDTFTFRGTPIYPASTWVLQEDGEWVEVTKGENTMTRQQPIAPIVHGDPFPHREFPDRRATYTVQSHTTTGDTFALRHEGNTITHISDVLSRDEYESLTADDLPDLDYTPYEGNPEGLNENGFIEWHAPTITYPEF